MQGQYSPVSTPNQSVRLKVTDWASPIKWAFHASMHTNHYDPNNGKPWRSVSDNQLMVNKKKHLYGNSGGQKFLLGPVKRYVQTISSVP